MTDPDYVHVTVVADASQAPDGVDIAIEVNSLVAQLVADSQRHTVTLVRILDEPRVDSRMVGGPIAWHFDSHGDRRALLDTIGTEIHLTGSDLASIDEYRRPGAVHFVVASAGGDTASTEYDLSTVTSLIEHQRDVYNWQFHFILPADR